MVEGTKQHGQSATFPWEVYLLCQDILSHFCEVQNYLQTEESLKTIVY